MAVLHGGLLTFKEEATGTINGINVSFTTNRKFILGTLRVQLNGLVQLDPDDYTETSDQSFDFVQAPVGGSDPDRITISYQLA